MNRLVTSEDVSNLTMYMIHRALGGDSKPCERKRMRTGTARELFDAIETGVVPEELKGAYGMIEFQARPWLSEEEAA